MSDVGGFWSLVWDHFDVIGSGDDRPYLPSVLPEAHFFSGSTLNLAENLLRVPASLGDSADASLAGPSVIATREGDARARFVQSLVHQELVDRVADGGRAASGCRPCNPAIASS